MQPRRTACAPQAASQPAQGHGVGRWRHSLGPCRRGGGALRQRRIVGHAGQYIEPVSPHRVIAARTAIAQRAAQAVPGQCEVCHRWGWARLCTPCRLRFAAARARCARCGLATGTHLAACGACLQAPPPSQRTVVAVDYGFPWNQLIGRWKFAAHTELSAMLADLLAEAVRHDLALRDLPPPELIVPVPLAPERLAERGFNQSWEIARRVARQVGTPAHAGVLERVLSTAHQIRLTRAERERNLRAAFTVPAAARGRLAARRVALVDDVLTTGATAREAAQALLRAGAAAVELWVLARTPAPAAA